MPKRQIILDQEEWDRLLQILQDYAPINSDAEQIGKDIANQLSIWHKEDILK